MTVKLTPMPVLNRRAFDILSREMGVPETLRFFRQLGLGTGDYTQERRELFEDLTMQKEMRQSCEGTSVQRASTPLAFSRRWLTSHNNTRPCPLGSMNRIPDSNWREIGVQSPHRRSIEEASRAQPLRLPAPLV